ncbi:hypothetical protein T484DRAFT_1967732 [Baffinella frigidus]|nr:hypothetical protein T484DRAFT_1967732 [Cryptophyta sp. CCMP2293]
MPKTGVLRRMRRATESPRRTSLRQKTGRTGGTRSMPRTPPSGSTRRETDRRAQGRSTCPCCSSRTLRSGST